MSYPVYGDVTAGSTLYIPFTSYDKEDGASITMTGLAVTDIEIYKNGSTTQRASDNGYTLLDTDGIDFDGVTGLHGFSIDLSDNTDSGFYTAGAWYWVVVSTVTIDSVVVTFIAAVFRIRAAESVAGTPKVDVSHLLGTAWLTPGTAGTPDVNAKLHGGTSQTGRDIGASVLLSAGTGTGQLDFTSGVVKSNLVQILATALTETAGLLAGGFKKFFNVSSPTGTLNSLPDAVPGASGGLPTTNGTKLSQTADLTAGQSIGVSGDFSATMKTSIGTAVAASAVASVTGNVGGNVTGSVGSLATQAKADVNAEVDSAISDAALATAAALATVDDKVDDIKAKTDQLTFTQTGHVDANVQRINDVVITGDGSGTPFGV